MLQLLVKYLIQEINDNSTEKLKLELSKIKKFKISVVAFIVTLCVALLLSNVDLSHLLYIYFILCNFFLDIFGNPFRGSFFSRMAARYSLQVKLMLVVLSALLRFFDDFSITSYFCKNSSSKLEFWSWFLLNRIKLFSFILQITL